MSRNLLLALTLAGLTGLTQIRADDNDMKLTPAKLVGTYRITKGEKYGGEPVSPKAKDTVVKFTKDRVTVFDTDDNEVYVQTYKLDANVKPCKLMLTAIKPKADAVAPGLIKMDGDKLTLIYALPEGKAPTEFKTHNKQLMFIMTKVKGTQIEKSKK